MNRPAAVVIVVAFLLALTIAVASARPREVRVIGHGQIRYDGAGPERWALRYRRARAELVELRVRLRLERRHRLEVMHLRVEQLVERPKVAIALMFGGYAGEAMQVADCETGGTFSTGATNGQYLGLFQMGSSERATYGDGDSPLAQARAAYVYFVVSGRDWSPWTCKP
jgi:hypothetical protein